MTTAFNPMDACRPHVQKLVEHLCDVGAGEMNIYVVYRNAKFRVTTTCIGHIPLDLPRTGYPGCAPEGSRVCVHGNPQGQICPHCDYYKPPTEEETLNKVAAEWLETRNIIMGLLAEIGVQGKEALEHNASAVIARLSHAGYSIDKMQENDNH